MTGKIRAKRKRKKSRKRSCKCGHSVNDWRRRAYCEKSFTAIRLLACVRLSESSWHVGVQCSVAVSSTAASRSVSTSRGCAESSRLSGSKWSQTVHSPVSTWVRLTKSRRLAGCSRMGREAGKLQFLLVYSFIYQLVINLLSVLLLLLLWKWISYKSTQQLKNKNTHYTLCLLYTSPSPRD